MTTYLHIYLRIKRDTASGVSAFGGVRGGREQSSDPKFSQMRASSSRDGKRLMSLALLRVVACVLAFGISRAAIVS